MNLEKIKEVIGSGLPYNVQETLILEIIAEDENVIPSLLNILEKERKAKSEVISDMNLELSRAHIYIELQKENKPDQNDEFNKSFVVSKISEFYSKYKHIVRHCFNRFND